MLLITCSGCETKIRVPDAAAGKRVKCPKCAAIIRVPALEVQEPETPPVLSKAPPPHEPPLEEPEPEEPAEESKESAETRVTASDSKSLSIASKSDRAKSDSDDEDEDDGPRKTSSRRGYDDEDEDARPPKRRSRRDDDEDDDDDYGVRKPRRPKQAPVTGLAVTSMIMGTISASMGVLGCCCCGLIAVIALICGIVAVVCGFMGRSPGSDGFALTGIITGFVGIALSMIAMIFLAIHLTAGGGWNDFNRGFNQGFNNGFNRNFNPPPPPPNFGPGQRR